MSEESFYGVTLTAENNAVSWDVLSNDEDYPRGQKLIIRQVLLGAEAKEDEFNVVEVCKISCAPNRYRDLENAFSNICLYKIQRKLCLIERIFLKS
uniref:Nucleoplasmin domain-containing protein n=1 Tax=Glossina austeni TaxID=7395 RepID=A0A1A9VVJ9_GLOAU